MPAGSLDPNAGIGYDPDPVTVSAGSSIIWDNLLLYTTPISDWYGGNYFPFFILVYFLFCAKDTDIN